MPVLLLIRHGENNVMQRRLSGRLPGIHLNDKGQRQAEELANCLKNAGIRAVYSSPLERAMQTAAPLAEAGNLEIQTHPGLQEIDYGDWQGRTYRQLTRLRMWKILHQAPEQAAFPGGETPAAAQARAVEALREIADLYVTGEIIACFTHADVIRLAAAHFLGLPLKGYQYLRADPAGISGLLLEGGTEQLLFFNTAPERLGIPAWNQKG